MSIPFMNGGGEGLFFNKEQFMNTLQLSDVKVGSVRKPTKWSNETRSSIELDPLQDFIGEFGSKTLQYVDGNVPGGAAYHRNYMMYLEKCWREHLGIVVTPDILWQILLSEFALITKADPEQYRHLFTISNEKQDIIVITGELVVMPLSLLIDGLKEKVPTDVDRFLPKFSTTTPRSIHAFRTAFADACSPYYNYSMLMCGFPAIDVRGTEEDYDLLASTWCDLSELFIKHKEWFLRVQGIFDKCVERFTDADWWREMFVIERCGSGGEVKASGWLTDLFFKKPEVEYPENFSSCVSVIDYKQLDTDKKYQMRDGLLMSKMEGDFLVPDFGFLVYENTEE